MNLALITLVVIGGPLALVLLSFVIWLALGYLGIAFVIGAKRHRKRVHLDEPELAVSGEEQALFDG